MEQMNEEHDGTWQQTTTKNHQDRGNFLDCLLYTSDAADE